jgi:hypothetical protein
MTLDQIIANSIHAHHFAGKFNGYVAALIETPNNVHGSHAVLIVGPASLHELPSMPEAEARRAFHAIVRDVNAKSVS